MEKEPAVTWRRTYRMQRQTLWPQLITHAQMPLLVLAAVLPRVIWPRWSAAVLCQASAQMFFLALAQTSSLDQLTGQPARR